MADSVHILLVDDSSFFLSLEKQFLRHSSARILEASSGQEALELCLEQRPDLVFIDFEMPKMDGSECCRKFKADPALAEIPIILICNEQVPEQAEQARKAGCDAVITKPIDRKRFLTTGHRFLSGIDRREARLPISTTIFFLWKGKSCYGECHDLSNGGLYLESQEPVKVGEQLSLSFMLPKSADLLIEAVGVVAWINTKETHIKPTLPYGFGIEFEGISDTVSAMIRSFLHKFNQSVEPVV